MKARRTTSKTHRAGVFRSRPFDSRDHEGCCLWCGTEIPERRDRLWVHPYGPVPNVGDVRTVAGRVVAIRDIEYWAHVHIPASYDADGEQIKGTGKRKKTQLDLDDLRTGTRPDYVYVRYSPQVYDGINPEDRVPLFCKTGTCAISFAMTTVQLGYRLHRGPRGAVLEHVKSELTAEQRERMLQGLAGHLDWLDEPEGGT